MIPASDILSGQWTSDGYPFRYVVIWHGKELVARARNKMVDTVLSAVEALEDQGWQLVSVDEAVSLACLRRLDHDHDRTGETSARPEPDASIERH